MEEIEAGKSPFEVQAGVNPFEVPVGTNPFSVLEGQSPFQDVDKQQELISRNKVDPVLASNLTDLLTAPGQAASSVANTVMNLGSAAVGSAYKMFGGDADNAAEADKITQQRIASISGKDKNKELQGLPARVTETIATVAPYVASLPMGMVGIAGMYNDVVDELVKSGLSLEEARKVSASKNAVMLVTTIIGGAAAGKLFGKYVGEISGKIGAGSVGGVAGTEAARMTQNAMVPEKMQQPFSPMDATVNALAFGGLGAMHPSTTTVKNVDKKPVVGLAPEWEAVAGGMSKEEHNLLSKQHIILDDKIQKINAEVAAWERSGDTSPEAVEYLTFLETSLKKAASDMLDLEHTLSGKNTMPDDVAHLIQLDMRKNEIMQQLRDLRKGPKPADLGEVTVDDISRLEAEIKAYEDRVAAGEQIAPPPKEKASPEVRAAAIELAKTKAMIEGFKASLERKKQQYEEQQKVAESPPVESVTSPHEVALTKIDEALQESKEKVVARMDDAMARLDALEERKRSGNIPGEEYSSMFEALNREIDAYSAIIEGKKPDLSWAEQGKHIEAKPLEVIPEVEFVSIKNKSIPTAKEVANLLRGKKTVGEVFDTLIASKVGTEGQRKLLSILNEIPHIRSALFKFGTAFKGKDGRMSRGAYDHNKHTVELHMDGNMKTVLHEAVHAASHLLLNDASSPQAQKLIALYAEYMKQDPKSKSYGATNIHEFVSEVLTSDAFQKKLAKIPSNSVGVKVENMLTAFKNIIAEGIQRLTGKSIDKSILDDAIDASGDLLKLAKDSSETFFQKLSDSEKNKKIDLSLEDELPTTKTIRGMFSRNAFGKLALSNIMRDDPMFQRAFHAIRKAGEFADVLQNKWMYGTDRLLNAGSVGVLNTLSKVMDMDSPHLVLLKTKPESMSRIHDVFLKGFEDGIDYTSNLNTNGSHLTDIEKHAYTVLSDMFSQMWKDTRDKQEKLGKKHLIPYREGWYPANRRGDYTVTLSYKGNLAYKQTFNTLQDANIFRRKVSDGTNLKHLELSDVMDTKKGEDVAPNEQMAEIIDSYLQHKFPSAKGEIHAKITDLIYSMQTRGGKLGYHHQFRQNIPGYKGSEMFSTSAERGMAFKHGIQSEVNNFGSNLKTLIIKTEVEPTLSNIPFKEGNPVSHAAIQQIFDTALGRDKDFFESVGSKKVENVVDKMVNQLSLKVLGKEFQAKEGTALSQASNVAMGVFYSTKMMAKAVFSIVGQLLTIPLTIPEMARDGHGIRAPYSFAKGMTKLLTGDRELWQNIKEVSQTYNTIEPQFLESLGLEKHSGIVTRTDKIVEGTRDWVLLGKVGTAMDGFSRLASYAIAFTHFSDLGLSKLEASYQARLLADSAMTLYGKSETAPMMTKMGFIGTQMRPLSSFGLNQLGNVVSYYKEFKKGNFGPMVAYGMVSIAMSGTFSLMFVQEYERVRQLLEKYSDVTMPSILEIFSGDESFLDRLNITSQEAKMVALYGLPALTGIDLSTSIRSNQTLFSIAIAIMMAQEDVETLMPILGATYETAVNIPNAIGAFTGTSNVNESRKGIDALVAGHVGYGLKELAGVNTTRVFGENTNKMPTGVAAKADMDRTPLAIGAGVLGAKTTEQKFQDQKFYEQTLRDNNRNAKIRDAADRFTETGDGKHLDRLIRLKATPKQIKSAIGTDAYNKLVDQSTTYYRNSKGHVDKMKAANTFMFGMKKD